MSTKINKKNEIMSTKINKKNEIMSGVEEYKPKLATPTKGKRKPGVEEEILKLHEDLNCREKVLPAKKKGNEGEDSEEEEDFCMARTEEEVNRLIQKKSEYWDKKLEKKKKILRDRGEIYLGRMRENEDLRLELLAKTAKLKEKEKILQSLLIEPDSDSDLPEALF